MSRATRRRLLQSSAEENCSKTMMVIMCSMLTPYTNSSTSISTSKPGRKSPWRSCMPRRCSTPATRSTDGFSTREGCPCRNQPKSHRYDCYRASTTKVCRHRCIGRASVAMQVMHDCPLQTRAPHAFLCVSQLELGRPSTSTLLQSQHCHAISSRTCNHGL